MGNVELGFTVTGLSGKLMSTSVSASRSKITDGGMFCDGGADAMGQATSLAVKEALERVAERISNSDKIRSAGKGVPAS